VALDEFGEKFCIVRNQDLVQVNHQDGHIQNVKARNYIMRKCMQKCMWRYP